MKTVAYIVDNDVLLSSRPREAYSAEPCPGDPTKSLVYCHWDNPNWEVEFEALPGVTWLGHPWDVPPADTIPLLASFYTDPLASRTTTIAAPVVDTPPESLASMLRKAGRRIA